jgi:DNA-binding NarL/FixJ family response regulator
VLAFSVHEESLYAERALRAGAKGYIMKHEATENLCNAIRKVLAGQIYVSDKIAAKMMLKIVGNKYDIDACAMDRLSDRELEVFDLIGQGHGTRQIAEKLYLSVKTIETHRAHIKEKLNLKDSMELLYYAIQWTNS